MGLTENDGHENDRASKLQDMKLMDQVAGQLFVASLNRPNCMVAPDVTLAPALFICEWPIHLIRPIYDCL